MFCDLNIFIVPLIIKSIFALNRKYNIGYHNDCNKNQPKNIKPFHIIYHHKLRFVPTKITLLYSKIVNFSTLPAFHMAVDLIGK